MATEVGSAYVSLLPSARGFGAAARKELRQALVGVDGQVQLTPDVDRAEAAAAGRRMAETAEAAAGAVELRVDVDRRSLRQLLPSLARLGGAATKVSAALGGLAAVGAAGAAAIAGLGAAIAGALRSEERRQGQPASRRRRPP